MQLFYYFLTVIFACFVQAVAGFGLPMVATPILATLFGIRAAVPMLAIIILELQVFMIFRYHSALNLRTVGRISAAAIIGIPIGVLFLTRIPEKFTVALLGVILIVYSLYSFSSFPVPGLKHPAWAYVFGFLSGIGGGAYNMAAPSMIIYADTQRWEPRIFKANLQGIFLIITLVAIISHYLGGNLTRDVLQSSLIALPFVIIGSLAGFAVDRYIHPVFFRKIVLGLLLLLGVRLTLTWFR